MTGPTQTDRGQVNLVDVIMALLVFICLIVLAPIYYEFTGWAAAEADAFTQLLLRLVLPLLFMALIISVGISAKSGA